MERVEKLENSTEESLGIEETVCMKSVERRMSESRVRENLMHGLMRGG